LHNGKARIDKLDRLLDAFVITDINSTDVVKQYAEIDTFSQGKLKSKNLNHSARNMDKNDIWIAATAAAAAEIPLLTTDNDFDHLGNTFISLIKVPILK
jgi:tRNA(fMet)-specific endonuclease VapC